jgi:hypothetical protein
MYRAHVVVHVHDEVAACFIRGPLLWGDVKLGIIVTSHVLREVHHELVSVATRRQHYSVIVVDVSSSDTRGGITSWVNVKFNRVALHVSSSGSTGCEGILVWNDMAVSEMDVVVTGIGAKGHRGTSSGVVKAWCGWGNDVAPVALWEVEVGCVLVKGGGERREFESFSEHDVVADLGSVGLGVVGELEEERLVEGAALLRDSHEGGVVVPDEAVLGSDAVSHHLSICGGGVVLHIHVKIWFLKFLSKVIVVS